MTNPHQFRTGQTVLVTGGSRNLGLAMCERFAAEGARVIVNGVVPGEAEAVAVRLRADGLDAHGIDADVSDAQQVEQMFAEIRKISGNLDVLVNNAAITMRGRVAMMNLTLDDWDRIFQVNARGTFLCSLAAVQLMQGRDASIVSISSIGATKAHRSALPYDATKGAVEAFTRAAALELAPLGIRVNAVAPGAISNDRFEALDEATRHEEASPIPLGRVGTGADVAAAVSFLSSTEASYITGQVLTVDGGLTAQARQATSEVRIEDAAGHSA